jgi:hypothetical protein
MNDLVQHWLDNPRLSQVQACCLRLPDGQCHTQAAGTELSSEAFEEVMNRIAAILPMLIHQQLLPGRSIWKFAHGELHYVVRPDRAALGLYCKLDPEASPAAVDEFIASFIEGA